METAIVSTVISATAALTWVGEEGAKGSAVPGLQLWTVKTLYVTLAAYVKAKMQQKYWLHFLYVTYVTEDR